MSFVDRGAVERFVELLAAGLTRPGRVYLMGDTSLVWEGARPWSEALLFAAEVAATDRVALTDAARRLTGERRVAVVEEAPGELVPLPDGWRERARAARATPNPGASAALLELLHFDPYSVSIRALALGDEADYQLVLRFGELGWVELGELDRLLAALLPRLTFETIQQDPAELRRRHRGLSQMWRARSGAP